MGDFQQGRQTVVDRLKRRLNNYRVHSNTSSSHLDQTYGTIYQDQHKQTLILKQRFVESKAKKNTKKTAENRRQDPSLSAMGQSKLLARGHDQTCGSGDTDINEPSAKKQKGLNGSASNSVTSDISNFQIVHQLNNLKSNIPLKNNMATSSLATGSVSENIDGLVHSGISSDLDEGIKKENDLDLHADSLLDDFGEFSNFEDIDMGINLEDFVHDLDLDNIKHENSNSGVDTFFKEEVGDSIFKDEHSSMSNSEGANSKAQPASNVNVSKSSNQNDLPSFSQYLNPSNQPNTPSSYPQTSGFVSPPAHSFGTTMASTPTTVASSYVMSNSAPKVRMNVNAIRQPDLVQASQTLKQMAEPYQTKGSPGGPNVRPTLNEYNYNMPNNSTMNQTTPVSSSQSYPTNQSVPMYNQAAENDSESKQRQPMMQSYSKDFQHINAANCKQPQNTQNAAQNVQQVQVSQNSQQPIQHNIQHAQQTGRIQQQNVARPVSGEHQLPQTQIMVQKQNQPTMTNQTQQLQSSHSNPQTMSGRNSLSPFANQLSPMNSYPHPQQTQNPMGMGPQYPANMCSGMPTSNSVHCSYQMTPRGATPMGQGTMVNPGGPQPRFMQQQMMGQVPMMRSQMVMASGQMMGRPPPPDYRQAAMMQPQHQTMMGQPLPQNMPHMHQNSGQIMFQMRSGIRPTGGPAMMSGGQMISGMNQQGIAMNVGTMDQTSGMNSQAMMNQSMSANVPGNMGSVRQPSMAQATGPTGMVMPHSMMQRMRTHYNTNMTSSQIPAANRGEWRPMMMQQQNPANGMMMTSDGRSGYHQTPDEGMMGQSGTMMTVQRPHGTVMAMRRMPSNMTMTHVPPVGNIPISHSGPAGQGHMAMGMNQQMSSNTMGQVNQGMQEQQNPAMGAVSQPHVEATSGIPPNGQRNSPNMSHLSQTRQSPSNAATGALPNQNIMTSMAQMVQNGPRPSNPGSPLTMCQRPSNPNLGVGSPVMVCSSPSVVRPSNPNRQAMGNHIRGQQPLVPSQNMVPNMNPQVMAQNPQNSNPALNPQVMPQNPQNSNPALNPQIMPQNPQNSNPVPTLNPQVMTQNPQNSNPVAKSNTLGNNQAPRVSQGSDVPPEVPTGASAPVSTAPINAPPNTDDFDLIFDGEFAALLS